MSQVLPEASWDWTNQHAETKLYLIFTDISSLSYFSSITCYFKAFKVWSPTIYSVDMTTHRTRTWLLRACSVFQEHEFFWDVRFSQWCWLKIRVFWNAMPCWMVNSYHCFKGARCLRNVINMKFSHHHALTLPPRERHLNFSPSFLQADIPSILSTGHNLLGVSVRKNFKCTALTRQNTTEYLVLDNRINSPSLTQLHFSPIYFPTEYISYWSQMSKGSTTHCRITTDITNTTSPLIRIPYLLAYLLLNLKYFIRCSNKQTTKSFHKRSNKLGGQINK